MLTWLHLSDFHAYTPRHRWAAARVTETLTQDLQRLQNEHGLRPDLLFFTGDAAFGQIGFKAEETIHGQLKHFATFLHAVRRAFEPEILLENVFLVPGNHDVDRKRVTPEQTYWLDGQTSIDPIHELIEQGGSRWSAYGERLSAYRDFLADQQLSHLLDDPRLIYATVRDIAGLRVGVAGFNTAWSCSRDGEKGRLWMAGKYQQDVLRPKLKGADLSIALLHHPPEWLVEHENPDFGRGLEQDFNFLLHGHEHRDWVLSTPGGGYSVLAAAACYEHSDGEHNGYNLVRLDIKTGRGEVWLRRFDSQGGGWVPRIVAGRNDRNVNGVWELQLDRLQERKGKRKPPAIPTAPSRKTKSSTGKPSAEDSPAWVSAVTSYDPQEAGIETITWSRKELDAIHDFNELLAQCHEGSEFLVVARSCLFLSRYSKSLERFINNKSVTVRVAVADPTKEWMHEDDIGKRDVGNAESRLKRINVMSGSIEFYYLPSSLPFSFTVCELAPPSPFRYRGVLELGAGLSPDSKTSIVLRDGELLRRIRSVYEDMLIPSRMQWKLPAA